MQATQTQAQTNPYIDEVMFSEPSGNVCGIVTAFTQLRQRSVRIGHCTLFTDREPKLTVTVPKSLDLEEIAGVTRTLDAFAAAVRRLDSTEKAQA
jgi:hypothetical protein